VPRGVQKKGIPRFADAGKSISIGPPLKWANASLSGIANRLRPLAGENHPDLVRLSPNLPWALQRLSLQGWILALRVVSYTGTKTTGARFPPRAVRLPTHGSALILGASCVDRGLSSEVNVPPRQPVPAINRLSLFNWFGVLVRIARENIEVCRSECPLWVKSRHFAVQTTCPLYPRKRTFAAAFGISAKCQYRTFGNESVHCACAQCASKTGSVAAAITC
jgi:hypothetical protein